MSQTALIITTLKQLLKQQGKTYADVAAALQLSEASVKRVFANQTISLTRLEEICLFLQMDINSVVEQAYQPHLLDTLTIAQEEEIVQDTTVLTIVVCVLSYWRYEELKAVHQVEDTYLTKVLLGLDNIGLIDLLPENKIRLKISPNFSWQPQGPIMQYFRKHLGTLFFHPDFADKSEHFGLLNGSLSEASLAVISQKIKLLEQEFTQCMQNDKKLPFEKKRGVTLLAGLQQWRHGLLGKGL